MNDQKSSEKTSSLQPAERVTTTVSSRSQATAVDSEPENVITQVRAGSVEEIVEKIQKGKHITPEMRAKVATYYGRKAEEDNLAPSADVVYILDKIALMTEEEALEILTNAISFHKDDPNFPGPTMEKIKLLVQGPKAAGTGSGTTDYDFDLKAEAAIIHYVRMDRDLF